MIKELSKIKMFFLENISLIYKHLKNHVKRNFNSGTVVGNSKIEIFQITQLHLILYLKITYYENI